MRERKREHIALALQEKERESYFSYYTLVPAALPEVNLEEVNPETTWMGKKLALPLMISSMTAGIKEADKINERLAACAEEKRIAMGIGSLRKVLEEKTRYGLHLRKKAPHALLLANLGAVQLNYGFTWEECQKAVDLMAADGLILHLNPMQEALQPEGNTNFSGLLKKIEKVVAHLSVPVMIKEVGQGLDVESVKKLKNCGIRYFDIAGKGGTSFTAIEARRSQRRRDYELFADWGIDTPTCLLQLRQIPDIELLASGGIRSGLDMAKALAMGATLTGMAKPLLQKALVSYNALVAFIDQLTREFKLAMFGCGITTVSHFKGVRVFNEKTRTFV